MSRHNLTHRNIVVGSLWFVESQNFLETLRSAPVHPTYACRSSYNGKRLKNTHNIKVFALEVDTGERAVSPRTKGSGEGRATSDAPRGPIQKHEWICATLLTVVRDVYHDPRIDCARRKSVPESDLSSALRGAVDNTHTGGVRSFESQSVRHEYQWTTPESTVISNGEFLFTYQIRREVAWLSKVIRRA